ncbi:MAG: site-specific DNA-methyltransferase [Lachnospiraceae bacterium]|nr:site-specific DNA-methyltransferase [Lachnospiraceae bacterium]
MQIANNENDLILDCFVGSGTTVAVAYKLGRNYLGIDIDERTFKYASDIINRAFWSRLRRIIARLSNLILKLL